MTSIPFDPGSFDAILFDMDGTLVDSEPVWFEVLQAVMGRHGAYLPDDAHPRLHGLDRAASTERLRHDYGLAGDTERFWSDVVHDLALALAQVPAMPGAAAMVQASFVAGQPRAVVSNSPRAMIDASLAGHAWGAHLQVRISVEDVARGKPAPDGYLLAAERLAVDVSRSLVVEDSEAGARAALAAGATCLFVTNGVFDEGRARALTPHVVAHLATPPETDLNSP